MEGSDGAGGGKKRFLLSLVIIFFSFEIVGAQSQVPSSTDVKTFPLANVSTFSVSPAFTAQNQIIDFIVTVENAGNVPINATPFVNITDSSNTTISNVTFTPLTILVGNNATFVGPWNTNGYPIGDYKGVVVVNYTSNITPPMEATFRIQAVAPPTGGGRRSRLTPPQNLTPPEELLPTLPVILEPLDEDFGESRISFEKYPVLEEVRPGESTTADVLVSNIGDAGIAQMSERVEGVPSEWVIVRSDDGVLEAGESRGVNMGFTVPAGAFPGNYRVSVVLEGEDSEVRTFFILRVKPYPAELERPSITRRVVIDLKESTSKISLKVENAGRFIKRLEIVEDVPKEIASNYNQLDFSVLPSEIIEADPIIKWSIGDIDFFETRTLTYESPITLQEYSPYVNWPIKQINILYDITSPKDDLEISRAEIKTLSPGKKEKLKVTISNTGVIPVNFSISAAPPAGWKIDPEFIAERIAPSSETTIDFEVSAPDEAGFGIYTVAIRLSYNGRTLNKDVVIFVGEPSFELPTWAIASLVLALLVGAGILARREYLKRREIYREEDISTIHKLEEEIMEEQ